MFHRSTSAVFGLLVGCSTAPTVGTPEDAAYRFDETCAPCHGAAGAGNPEIAAPAIAGLPAWYVTSQLHKFRDGVRGTHFDDIEGMRMRPMAKAVFEDAAIDALGTFVEALPSQRPAPTVAGDAAAGQASYATCTACHLADGSGNPALQAPPLTHQPDWYLVKQLAKFKHGVRGAHPKDTSGATMRPMAQTLADEAAMNNVIAYVMTLGK